MEIIYSDSGNSKLIIAIGMDFLGIENMRGVAVAGVEERRYVPTSIGNGRKHTRLDFGKGWVFVL